MKYYVENLDKILKNLTITSDKALEVCAMELASKLKAKVEEDSYDLGNLAGSITYRQVKPGVMEVGSNLEYAPIREYGRQPGRFPNLDAMVGRTARKGMIPKGNVTKDYDDLYYKDKGIVYIVARAIATRGIKGKYTFKKVYEAEKQNIINLYSNLMAK